MFTSLCIFFYSVVHIPARKISDVYKCVVEASEDVSDAKDVLALLDLRSKADLLNNLLGSLPFWAHGHYKNNKIIHVNKTSQTHATHTQT